MASDELESRRYRPTREATCPHCGASFGYHAFSGMADLAPHFYCDTCSNVLWRESDRASLDAGTDDAQLLETIAPTLPCCPCGGRFGAGRNPKCPGCRRELPHQATPAERLRDPHAIVVEGARLLTVCSTRP